MAKPKPHPIDIVKARAVEELVDAGGNHRMAFCNVLDLRGCDKRMKQFRFFGQVLDYMMTEWQELY